ncbi:hypothetical protein SC171_05645 [Pantoea cypripedii]|uniref:hypothetical protein n=1 Tax=Pantoea cypripedii TaxID=55209 RepID=UPI002FCB1D2D
MEISSTQFGVVAAKSYLKPNKKDYLKRVEKDFPNLPLAEKQKIADEIYNFDKIEAEIKNKKLIRNTTDDVIIMLDQELMKLYQKRYEFMNGQYDVYLKSIKPVAYSEAMNQLNITGDFQGAKEKLINSPDEVNKIGEKPSTEFIGDLNERIENANRYFISLYSKSIDNKN